VTVRDLTNPDIAIPLIARLVDLVGTGNARKCPPWGTAVGFTVTQDTKAPKILAGVRAYFAALNAAEAEAIAKRATTLYGSMNPVHEEWTIEMWRNALSQTGTMGQHPFDPDQPPMMHIPTRERPGSGTAYALCYFDEKTGTFIIRLVILPRITCSSGLGPHNIVIPYGPLNDLVVWYIAEGGKRPPPGAPPKLTPGVPMGLTAIVVLMLQAAIRMALKSENRLSPEQIAAFFMALESENRPEQVAAFLQTAGAEVVQRRPSQPNPRQ
jgi:hypothetical protein